MVDETNVFLNLLNGRIETLEMDYKSLKNMISAFEVRITGLEFKGDLDLSIYAFKNGMRNTNNQTKLAKMI